MAELPRRGGDMLIKHNLRPEQAVEARDCLVDTLIQTNKHLYYNGIQTQDPKFMKPSSYH